MGYFVNLDARHSSMIDADLFPYKANNLVKQKQLVSKQLMLLNKKCSKLLHIFKLTGDESFVPMPVHYVAHLETFYMYAARLLHPILIA